MLTDSEKKWLERRSWLLDRRDCGPWCLHCGSGKVHGRGKNRTLECTNYDWDGNYFCPISRTLNRVMDTDCQVGEFEASVARKLSDIRWRPKATIGAAFMPTSPENRMMWAMFEVEEEMDG